MKVLFFDSDISDSQNGGKIGLERNLKMTKEMFGSQNVRVCALHNPTKLRGFFNFVLDRSFYDSTINDKRIKKAISEGPYDFIFLNGPMVYKYLKPFLNNKPIIYLYCHNVDYEYYRQRFHLSRSIRDFLMLKYIKKMEAFAVKQASIISTLNNRDADGIQRWYNRKVDFILPIGMDSLNVDQLTSTCDQSEGFGLFVGSSIEPNIEGLKWFFEKVLPYTRNIKYKIVGSCCNYFKNYPLPENIDLEGRVDDLSSYYRNASFVICPIFSGSGMKTKTIEALRFGKTIIGTNEAFEGIEVNYNKVGLKSDSPKEFISKINALNLTLKFNEVSYREFENKFSFTQIFTKFKSEIVKFQKHDNKK